MEICEFMLWAFLMRKKKSTVKRYIATNANEGWNTQLQFEKILQKWYMILKTIMILILLQFFFNPLQKFRVHIELQKSQKKTSSAKNI